MKLKSLAALGMASMVAAAVTCMTPVMADDISSNVGSDDAVITQTPADTTTTQQADTAVQSTDNSGNTTTDSSSATADQGTPDTATGDDDY